MFTRRLVVIFLVLFITAVLCGYFFFSSGVTALDEKEYIPLIDNSDNSPMVIEVPIEEVPIAEQFNIDFNDVIILARLMYGECRGVRDDNKKAAVCWVVLNRLDTGEYGDTIEEVVSKNGQFTGYKEDNPLLCNLYEIAFDVLYNYGLEKEGVKKCNRVIPKEYLWFYGNGTENIFKNYYEYAPNKNCKKWDWSL